MLEKTIILKSFEAVKNFVDIANTKPYDIELVSGNYVVNAKSIMGVFSLDLTKPIGIEAHTDDAAAFLAEIAPYKVD